MPYDPKTDYAIPERARPFQPTKDDPICARCGYPKHHHFHGNGALAVPDAAITCPAFDAASPIIVRTTADDQFS